MTNYRFLIILTCMTCLFYTSCEKTGLQSTQIETLNEKLISYRTVDDCEDCPLDYCCCSIELWGTTTIAPLNLCGFSNGASMCGTYNPPGNCEDFSGVGENILLEAPDNRGVIVCKEEYGVFRIANTSNNAVTLRMTCQADHTAPQFVIINIPSTSDVFYSTDGDCVLTECE